MMEIILNILIISVICCCIVDISGFIEEFETILTKGLSMKTRAHIPKPFSCSLCLTHWLSVLYVIVIGEFSLMIYAIILLISIMTPVITEAILLLRGLLNKVIVLLGRWLSI